MTAVSWIWQEIGEQFFNLSESDKSVEEILNQRRWLEEIGESNHQARFTAPATLFPGQKSYKSDSPMYFQM